MKRASIELKIAGLDSLAFRYLRLAADLRRRGNYADSKLYVRISKRFDAPRLPDRRSQLAA